jgi:sulfite reductase alpha subunit-like flavoprotein
LSVGLGSGIAPIRSLCQDRDVAKKAGEKLGRSAVIFGNRNSANEYYYRDEIEQYLKNGSLDEIHTAFSRD